MVGGKVDGQILFGTRSEKPKILFGATDEKRKIYLAPNDSYESFYLAVKGLMCSWKECNSLPSAVNQIVVLNVLCNEILRLEHQSALSAHL